MQPFNNVSVPSIRTVLSSDPIGEFFRMDNIVGTFVSSSPLIATLTITSDSTFDRATVTCTSQSGAAESVLFNAGGMYVRIITCVNCMKFCVTIYCTFQ